MGTLLISLDDIREYRPVSQNIPDGRALPYIEEVQISKIRDLLGVALYDRLIAEAETPGGDTEAATLTEQVKPYLCYLSWVQIGINNAFNLTTHGLVQKNDEYSDAIEDKTFERVINSAKSMAYFHRCEIVKFICDNSDDYPEYDGAGQNKTSSKTSPRIGWI